MLAICRCRVNALRLMASFFLYSCLIESFMYVLCAMFCVIRAAWLLCLILIWAYLGVSELFMHVLLLEAYRPCCDKACVIQFVL